MAYEVRNKTICPKYGLLCLCCFLNVSTIMLPAKTSSSRTSQTQGQEYFKRPTISISYVNITIYRISDYQHRPR
ncbi:hypothetical protein PDJAM_G00121930 [Pangasius djambal]|uniref:Uncharacterized protein n=1 Tax=Pangasius djambal TaxID=1691987 RepID=A0ACC5ZA65_9TELE|nr:hypothetical protein [Pangasius djambal]